MNYTDCLSGVNNKPVCLHLRLGSHLIVKHTILIPVCDEICFSRIGLCPSWSLNCKWFSTACSEKWQPCFCLKRLLPLFCYDHLKTVSLFHKRLLWSTWSASVAPQICHQSPPFGNPQLLKNLILPPSNTDLLSPTFRERQPWTQIRKLALINNLAIMIWVVVSPSRMWD